MSACARSEQSIVSGCSPACSEPGGAKPTPVPSTGLPSFTSHHHQLLLGPAASLAGALSSHSQSLAPELLCGCFPTCPRKAQPGSSSSRSQRSAEGPIQPDLQQKHATESFHDLFSSDINVS